MVEIVSQTSSTEVNGQDLFLKGQILDSFKWYEAKISKQAVEEAT